MFTRCNLCGGQRRKLLFKNFDRLHKFPGIFDVAQCCKCGLVCLYPGPEDIRSYYPDDYAPHSLPKVVFPETLTRRLLNYQIYYKEDKNFIDSFRAFLFEKIYSPIPIGYLGKVLDIGCGSGIYLFNLKKLGWDVYGLDSSQKAVSFARDRLKLKNIFSGTLDDKKYPTHFFDVVCLSHVIEHLPNPRQTLVEIRRIIRPGGLLLITTPNFGSFGARVFREYWYPLDTPRHLFLFSKSSLEKMIEAVGGFEIEKVSYGVATDSFAKSLGYLLSNRVPMNNLLMMLRIILFPYTIFLSLIGRADTMTFRVIKNV